MRKFGLRNRNRSAGKVITAAIVGSVVGAAVGLLMAPTTGEEMRRRIRSGAADARERIKDVAENVESRAREIAGEAREQVNDMQGSVSRRKTATTRTTPELER